MSRKFTGKQTEGVVREKRANGDVYVYQRIVGYNRETKKSFTVSKTLKGKIPAGQTEMVPTRPRKKPQSKKPQDGTASLAGTMSSSKAQEGGELAQTASRKHVGSTKIMDWVGKESGIDADLARAFPQGGDANKIKSVARYMAFSGGKSLPCLESWQITHSLPYDYPISKNVYSKLFQSIGQNEDSVQRYFLGRGSNCDGRNILAFDSTTISTYSNCQKEARKGFNKDGDGLNTIKLLTLYSIDKQQPIAFSKQPGNLTDVVTIQNTIKQVQCLKIDNPLIITDNGYYSDSNVSLFCSNKMKFLTLANKKVKWIKDEINKAMPTIDDIQNTCPFDGSIKGCVSAVSHKMKDEKGKYFTEKLYVYTYYNALSYVEEKNNFDVKLTNIMLKLNDDKQVFDDEELDLIGKYIIKNDEGSDVKYSFNYNKIKEKLKYTGFFTLVSNDKLDVFTALKYYRMREKLEELFATYKGDINGRHPHSWYADNLRGRLFVQFVAIGYILFLYNRIKKIKEKLFNDINTFQIKLKEANDKYTNHEDIIKYLHKNGVTNKNNEANRKLLNWLNNRSLQQILDWFDCVEETSVQNKAGTAKWTTETTKQDQLFLQLLMGENSQLSPSKESPDSSPQEQKSSPDNQFVSLKSDI